MGVAQATVALVHVRQVEEADEVRAAHPPVLDVQPADVGAVAALRRPAGVDRVEPLLVPVDHQRGAGEAGAAVGELHDDGPRRRVVHQRLLRTNQMR